MLITYKKLSLNQKSTYYYILCFFPIQFCVSLCIGCTGKRSGISVKGLRKFLSSEGVCCLCAENVFSYNAKVRPILLVKNMKGHSVLLLFIFPCLHGYTNVINLPLNMTI